MWWFLVAFGVVAVGLLFEIFPGFILFVPTKFLTYFVSIISATHSSPLQLQIIPIIKHKRNYADIAVWLVFIFLIFDNWFFFRFLFMYDLNLTSNCWYRSYWSHIWVVLGIPCGFFVARMCGFFLLHFCEITCKCFTFSIIRYKRSKSWFSSLNAYNLIERLATLRALFGLIKLHFMVTYWFKIVFVIVYFWSLQICCNFFNSIRNCTLFCFDSGFSNLNNFWRLNQFWHFSRNQSAFYSGRAHYNTQINRTHF